MVGKSIRVLLLEDAPDDAELVMLELEEHGYEVSHERVMTEAAFRQALDKGDWHLIISDHSMPQFSGTRALEILNQYDLDIPFIVVSGTIGEDAAVEEMRSGAADYVLKGNLKRLIPAITRELREAEERQARRQAEARLAHKIHLDRLVQEIAIAANAAQSIHEILQLAIEQLCQFTEFETGHIYFQSKSNPSEFVSSKIWYPAASEKYRAFRKLSEEMTFEMGNGFIGQVIATRAPRWLPDTTQYEPFKRKSVLTGIGLHTACALPIVTDDEVFAVLEIFASQRLEPDELLLEVTGHIGALISRVVERERHEATLRASEEQERQQRVLAEALKDSIATLTSSLDLGEVMKRILDSVGRVVPHDAANIMLIEGDDFHPVYWRGYAPEAEGFFVALSIPLTTPGYQEALDSEYPRLVADTKDAEHWVSHPQLGWIRSYVGAPIIASGKTVGVLNLDSAEPNFFTPQHAERLQAFADQASAAIQNAQLYAEIQRYSNELEDRVAERTASYLQQKERVEAILHNTKDAIFLARTDGRIQQTNPAFDQLFKLDIDEAVQFELVELIFEDDRKKARAALNQVVRGRQQDRLEVLAQRRDGVIFSAELSLSTLSDEQGKKEGIVGTFHDITPHNQVKESLREALHQERELRELKSRFVSMATHELKTPLASILMSANMIHSYRQRLSEEDIDRKLKQIEAQVKHLSQMVEDVLLIGHSESGRIEFDPEPTDLPAFCAELTKELAVNLQAKERIILETSGDCQPIAIDRKLMRQALTNFLSNAVKYSPDGGEVHFRLRCAAQEFVMAIQDQGIGIPEEDQARLFEAFHRADNVGKISGTGLGLVVAQRAVEMHGGTISVESQVNVGTTFTIVIPIAGRNNAHHTDH